MTVVSPDDLRVVLTELGRSTRPPADVIAAANRLRDAIEPSLFTGPRLSDPAADTVGASHGRETEQRAAWENLPRSGTQRLRVLAAVALAGDLGRTDEELENMLELRRPSPGNRRGELVAGGWVRDSGMRRPTRTGAQAVVWVLTDEGARRIQQSEQERQ